MIFPQKLYKEKFEKEKGKSNYNNMAAPPDVQHAMEVAKKQSNVRTGFKNKLNVRTLLFKFHVFVAGGL